jgi:hypothetical protein
MVTAAKRFLIKHKKYTPVIFFIGGFIWDSLTLGRIDGWYSNTILLAYLICLTICLYIFNLADDDRWENTFLEPYEEYAPLAIQFFLGGLSSAYVIFFFQSVTLTKTIVFFLILLVLLLSNELLKHRISNKYLQFGAYYFVNFTFFIFFLPIVFETMNTFLFVVSGILSLSITLFLIGYIYNQSPSTRREITWWKISTLIISIYLFINTCYYFNLIPPVPLSLNKGLVAYNIEHSDNIYSVSYEQAPLLAPWNSFDQTFNHQPGDTVFIFTSIFAPSNLEKEVFHKWKSYNSDLESWNITDQIGFNILGGRESGFRGYTYKENVWPGRWQIDVVTEEGQVLGKINFTIVSDSSGPDKSITTEKFE